MDRELTPKQQTSEAIRQADNILIITGQHPTADQVSAVMGLGMVLRKFGKKASTVISDDVPQGVKFLPMNTIDRKLGGQRDFIMRVDLARAEVDKLKYTLEDGKLNVHVTPFSGTFTPQDISYDYGPFQYDIVIVIGVAAYNRIDRVYSQNAEVLTDVPLINIDFHRSNEQYGAVNLVDGNAASLGEILVALSESLQTGLIDAEIATVFLTGIMAATDRFTANHTTSKALTVAAQMMAAGADQQKVVKGLYKSQPKEQKPAQQQKQPAASQPTVLPKNDQAPEEVANPEAAKVLQSLAQLKNPPRPEAKPAEQTKEQKKDERPAKSDQPKAEPKAEQAQPKPQPAKSLIAGGKLQGGQTPSQAAADQPQAASAPENPAEPVMEELLPPRHIEMSEYEYQGEEQEELPEVQPAPEVHPAQTALVEDAEPLINFTDPIQPTELPQPQNPPQAIRRGVNPANITYFQS